MSERAVGWIHEVFSSIQGEGLFCGQRHIFVRFAGCNLSCAYCDEPSARMPNPRGCRIAAAVNGASCLQVPNPVRAEDLAQYCTKLTGRTISLTGGEPLLQAEFASELARLLKQLGFAVHLETNGTLFDAVSNIAALVDVVAMDIKVPSASGCVLWDQHGLFLKSALRTGAFVFVKAIVGPTTTEDEIIQCAYTIASESTKVPLVIQPVNSDRSVPGELLMKLQAVALDRLEDVRVIPQCHKFLGLP